MRSKQWFLELKGQAIHETTQAANEYWPSPIDGGSPYYNFRLEHIRQVERDAQILMKGENADSDIILASVWIHDKFQTQFAGAQHAKKAAAWANKNLFSIGFPIHKIDRVSQCVHLHTRRDLDIPHEMTEARILWDADHLSRLGPVNMINYMMCHLAKDYLEELPNNSQFRSGSMSIKDFTPLLMEKRSALYRADWFYYDMSRTIARQRIGVMRAFLDVLEAQTQ